MRNTHSTRRHGYSWRATMAASMAVLLTGAVAGKELRPADEPRAVATGHGELSVQVRLAHPVVAGDQVQRSFVQVDIIPGQAGYEAQAGEMTDFPATGDVAAAYAESVATAQRMPVNLAIVLDRSATMQGERLRRCCQAIEHLLDWLREDDVLAIVVYDSNIQVLQPAMHQPDRERLSRLLSQLEGRGHSNLFGGVTRGAAELRRFAAIERVSRVLLLSDGKATIGPGTPKALGELGASLQKEGISVSTIGLGLDYNEDLMVELAVQSQGNHHFVERPEDLVDAFEEELRQLQSIAATGVVLRLGFAPGIKPVRSLGLPVDIHDRLVTAHIGQVSGGQVTTLLLEVLIDPVELLEDSEVLEAQFTTVDARSTAQGAPRYGRGKGGVAELPAAPAAPVARRAESAPEKSLEVPAEAEAGTGERLLRADIGDAYSGALRESAAPGARSAGAAVAAEAEADRLVPPGAPAPMSAQPGVARASGMTLIDDDAAESAPAATEPAPDEAAPQPDRSQAAIPVPRQRQADAAMEAGAAAEEFTLAAPALDLFESDTEENESSFFVNAREPGDSQVPQLRVADHADEVAGNIDVSVLALAMEQQAREQRERAIELRDAGEVKLAEELLLQNSAELEMFSQDYEVDRLQQQADQQRADAGRVNLTGEDWGRVRKELRALNYRMVQPGWSAGVEPAESPANKAEASAPERAEPVAKDPSE